MPYSYDAEVARLDRAYVEAVGAEIMVAIRECAPPIGVNYWPDNGTAYQLLFVPVGNITQVGADIPRERAWPEPWPIPSAGFDPGRRPHDPSVLVVKCNGTDGDFSYVFDFEEGRSHHLSYVAEHTRLGFGDAVAITALFRAMCGVRLYDDEVTA